MPSAINLAGPLGPEQFRNKLINGDFTFWQRGTSDTQGPASAGAAVSSFGLTFVSDRWFSNSNVANGFAGGTASVPRVRFDRQGFTMGQPSLSDVGGSQYFMRTTIGAADGTGVVGVLGGSMDIGNAYLQVGQHIEANDLGEWSGKTVWLSFLAKSFGNITHPTIGCRIGIRPDHNDTLTGEDVWPDSMTGVTAAITSDGNNGFNRSSNIPGDNINLTPEWQKFKRKFILPEFTSGVTQGTDGVSSVSPFFTLACGPSGPGEYISKSQVTDYLGLTSGFTGAFDVAQVQLEIGNDVSPFEKRHPQVELGMCQRYYQKSYNSDIFPGTASDYGAKNQTSTQDASIPKFLTNMFQSPLRTTPTVTIYAPKTGTINKLTRSWNSGGIDTPSTVYNVGEHAFYISSTNDAEGLYHWQFTADAEL